MTEPIYQNEKYKVILCHDALGEDGKYGVMGYAVVNLETNISEHTTMVLPQALFQADAFMGALSNLTSTEDEEILGNAPEIIIDPDDTLQ